jgi:hypothetical protein
VIPSSSVTDHLVHFERNGKLGFSVFRQYYWWITVSGLVAVIACALIVSIPFYKTPLLALHTRQGDVGWIVMGAILLYFLSKVYEPWCELTFRLAQVSIDFPSKRLNLKGQRSVELCTAKAIVIQKDEKAIEAKYLILINHDSGVQTPIQFLAFDNWESAQTVANRIAKFLEVPVDIRKDKE